MNRGKVVLYGASWCQPCKAFKPHWNGVAQGYLNRDLGVDFEYKDVDEMDPVELADAGVQAVPTVILYRDGAEYEIRSRTAEKLELEIEHYVDR